MPPPGPLPRVGFSTPCSARRCESAAPKSEPRSPVERSRAARMPWQLASQMAEAWRCRLGGCPLRPERVRMAPRNCLHAFDGRSCEVEPWRGWWPPSRSMGPRVVSIESPTFGPVWCVRLAVNHHASVRWYTYSQLEGAMRLDHGFQKVNVNSFATGLALDTQCYRWVLAGAACTRCPVYLPNKLETRRTSIQPWTLATRGVGCVGQAISGWRGISPQKDTISLEGHSIVLYMIGRAWYRQHELHARFCHSSGSCFGWGLHYFQWRISYNSGRTHTVIHAGHPQAWRLETIVMDRIRWRAINEWCTRSHLN